MQPKTRSLRVRCASSSLWWLGASVILSLWVVDTVGGFDLFVPVETPSGIERVVNTFATVDHPFHAARAVTLAEALGDGYLLRWVGHHQGGYPIEFYPLGIAWLNVIGSALTYGALPVIAVHKLIVLLLFLAPGVAFWLLVRGDRLSAAVAFLGLCAQVAIPGDWTHGGYTELVQWGLVTNVGGATAVLIATAALARYGLFGGRWSLLLAVLMSAGAAYINPRSLLGLGVAAVAIWLSALLPSAHPMHDRRRVAVTLRVALVTVLALLLAVPELTALVRFRGLYQFLHYQAYETLREYWNASVQAVSPPVLVAAVLGGFWATISPWFPVARAIAITTVGYAVLTVILTSGGVGSDAIQQLETPRLMPFQRFLTLYLAAFGVVRLITVVTERLHLPSATAGIVTLLGIGTVAATVLPIAGVPPVYHGLYDVEGTGGREFATFRDAVAVADEAAPPGTAILIIGSRLSWHEQLWAPLDTDHPLFYDDWLWYWHSMHEGPYIYTSGHFYPEPVDALTRDYFDTHGIGAVVITDRPTTFQDEPQVAARQPDLIPVTQGVWDVYRVNMPATIATVGDKPAERITVEDQRIVAEFKAAPGGELVVRQNWFPRWSATVNGAQAEIKRRADGYMAIQVPAGDVALVLSYTLEPVDWFARIAAAVGVIALVATMLFPSWIASTSAARREPDLAA